MRKMAGKQQQSPDDVKLTFGVSVVHSERITRNELLPVTVFIEDAGYARMESRPVLTILLARFR